MLIEKNVPLPLPIFVQYTYYSLQIATALVAIKHQKLVFPFHANYD